jgi:hypothetical protein
MIGDTMTDYTIYAGVSSKTDKLLFIPGPGHEGGGPLMTFNDVQEALKNLADHGHHFHLPTKEELFHGPFNKCASVRSPEWTDSKTAGETLDEGKTYRGKPLLIPTRSPKP